MRSANRWLVLAIVSSALFLIVVDMTVLYTALPRLTRDLGASASEKLWIVNAYALVVTGLLPGLGTLGDRFGHKSLFLAGLAVFGLASLIAAFAPVPAVLIVGRVVLAIGAAMMMPATLSIIRLTFEDDRERSLAIGIWAAVASGGAAFGPVLGGILLEFFWWGSVFLINVPIVAAALLAGALLVPARPRQAARPWDVIGSLQVLAGLVGVAYAIKEMGKRQPSLAAILVAASIGAAGLILFVRRQRSTTHPLIELALFQDRGFSVGVATALVASMALAGVELVITQRLQLVLDRSPLEAGFMILPIPLAAFVAGPLAGLALPRLGDGKVAWMALVIAGIGLAAYILMHRSGALAQILGLSVLGFGIGAAMTAASSSIMMRAPPDQAGMAASVEEVSFELGNVLGIAVLGTVMSAVYSWTMEPPPGLAVPASVFDSLDEALAFADGLARHGGQALRLAARSAFDQAFLAVLAAAAVLFLATALSVRAVLARQARPRP